VAEANARMKKNKTFVYSLCWDSPVWENGASHACELPFVFHCLELPASTALLGNNAPVALADQMHQAWVDFIRNGNPGWEEYDLKDRAEMHFNVESKIVKNPHPITRKFWDDKR